MRARSLMAGGVLFLSMVAIGSAKSWDIIMGSATKAGSVVLPAGNYNIRLKNNTEAVFTAADSGKTYNVPVKVEQAQHKYGDTAIETKQEGNQQVVQSIDLGGTADKLEFGE